MSFHEYLDEWHGLPAFTFPAPGERGGELGEEEGALPAAGAVAWRITSHWLIPGETYRREDTWESTFGRFLDAVDTAGVRALIVGDWGDAQDTDPSEAIGALLAARDRLPALRAVFLGDILDDECELSRIGQTDVTPLLAGFPALEEFGVRAGEGESMGEELTLAFPALRHDGLRRLTVQSAGLSAEVVRGIGASELPALEFLELWLGTSEYGGDGTVADLAPILSGARLPRLRHLALRNSEIQDEIAAAAASAPVAGRLETLDVTSGWGE